MGIRERERGHNGADLEAQKLRNEAEAGSMTSHYFVKWQPRIVNNSGTAWTTGTDTCTATVTCSANGISSNGNSNTAWTTGTGACTATGSTSLELVLQLVLYRIAAILITAHHTVQGCKLTRLQAPHFADWLQAGWYSCQGCVQCNVHSAQWIGNAQCNVQWIHWHCCQGCTQCIGNVHSVQCIGNVHSAANWICCRFTSRPLSTSALSLSSLPLQFSCCCLLELI